MIHAHQTAPTQFVDAAGIRFAYRRFGKSGGVPLVLFMHFTGTMDHWDPLVTDGLAATREVILFNNAGISSSSGEVPTTIEGMAAEDRKSTRLNSSHLVISYAVFCLKKKKMDGRQAAHRVGDRRQSVCD